MNIALIPVLTLPSGQALTLADWESVGVSVIALQLEALLYSPGALYFAEHSLRELFPWHGQILLDASNLVAKNGVYNFKSPKDGSKFSLTMEEMEALLIAIAPDFLLPLPGMESKCSIVNHMVYHHDEPIGIMQRSVQEDGFAGKIYSMEHCNCCACGMGLTQVYLHHLYQMVIMLGQRYIIMHNVACFNADASDTGKIFA